MQEISLHLIWWIWTARHVRNIQRDGGSTNTVKVVPNTSIGISQSSNTGTYNADENVSPVYSTVYAYIYYLQKPKVILENLDFLSFWRYLDTHFHLCPSTEFRKWNPRARPAVQRPSLLHHFRAVRRSSSSYGHIISILYKGEGEGEGEGEGCLIKLFNPEIATVRWSSPNVYEPAERNLENSVDSWA